MNARCIQYNSVTGKCVTDSTPRCGDIGNDQGYCGKVTGNPDIHSCKANPEGSDLKSCDLQFLGVPCPIWQYSLTGAGNWQRCLPDGIGPDGQPFSCDHFDGWAEAMGTYTGQCQHDNTGLLAPVAGFGMVPHGSGYVRACDALGVVCSGKIAVNY
jgi:hypothetical protein